MVPFSFKPKLSYSRGMKKSIYTLRPAAMGLGGDAVVAGLLNNWVQRHAGLVRQSCRFAPIKKLPCLPMLPSKNPPEPNGRDDVSPPPCCHEPNSFLEPSRLMASFISYRCPSAHPWLKKPVRFQGLQ